jgi:flagellar hook-associated protein 3 FlgL
MKISNRLFNDQQIRQFSQNMEDIQRLQGKISSGKNILFASDDPVGAVELSGLNDVTTRIDQYLKNTNLAYDRLQLMDSTLEGAKDIFIRCNELAIQASNDVLGVGDREAIALEFDELKKELLSIANIQDSGGSYIYAGFKSQTQPFIVNSSGLIEYHGDRGVLNLQLSESRLVESTIDGATVFQDIVTSAGVSTDLFAAIDNVSNSIRTANAGVEAAKADTGIAKVTLTNQNPGTYSFTVTSGSKSVDFSLDITGSDLTDVATLINSANLDITATLQDSNKTLKLVSDYGYDIELGKVQIQNIDKSQKTPTSFFTLQPVDASDAAIGNAQQVFDFDQTIASRLDELVVIQNHLANQRAKVGARMNSVERQQDIMNERKVLVEKDVSELADADLSELVTELQSMMTSQEASQKAFVRISQLNLFDMIS